MQCQLGCQNEPHISTPRVFGRGFNVIAEHRFNQCASPQTLKQPSHAICVDIVLVAELEHHPCVSRDSNDSCIVRLRLQINAKTGAYGRHTVNSVDIVVPVAWSR